MTFSTTNKQDSDLVTLVCISLLRLHITYSVFLMLTFHWRFLAFSLSYLKHLIKFGMMVSFINSRVMKLTVTYLFKLTKSFLNNRSHRVVLNGQSSVWKSVTVGVPQGSVLGLSFLIYICYLPLGRSTNVKLFAFKVKESQLIRQIHVIF